MTRFAIYTLFAICERKNGWDTRGGFIERHPRALAQRQLDPQRDTGERIVPVYS